MKSFLFSMLMLFSAAVVAAENPSVRIENPQAAETPPGAKTGAVYLDIVNTGNADRLLGAEAGDVAGYIEMHATLFEGNMMRMRKVEAIDLASGATTSLKPGGMHIMLIDMKQPLQAGQDFPLTLRFEKAGMIRVSVPVRKREAMTETMQHHGHDHAGHAKP
jgi:hypothetical protein